MPSNVQYIVVAGLSLTSAVLAQNASFQPLGAFSAPPVMTPNSHATGVSQGGSIICGYAVGVDAVTHLNAAVALYRTASGAWQTIPDTGFSSANAVSSDGTAIVGTGPINTVTGAFGPFVFHVGGQTTFPSLPSGSFLAISGNGTVAAGSVGGHAISWTQAAGMQDLGHIPGWNGNFATALGVSSGGIVMVGSDIASGSPQAFRWTLAEGMVGLGFLNTAPGLQASEAHAISADGLAIVGRSKNAAGVYQGFLWNAGQGMRALPLLSGATGGVGNAVSGDGSIVVGEVDVANGSAAYYWDRVRGRRDLRQYLTSLGATGLNGWTLQRATAISPDGTWIVGDGVDPQGVQQAWLAHLPPLCYANCDGSTATPVLNVSDFVCFQSRFVAGDAYANCDNSTAAPTLNVADFICFQAKFVAGCP